MDEFRSSEIKIIIGPISFEEFDQVKKYNDLTFISLSNFQSEFSKNVISIGVSLESQLITFQNLSLNKKKQEQ